MGWGEALAKTSQVSWGQANLKPGLNPPFCTDQSWSTKINAAGIPVASFMAAIPAC